MTGSRRNGVAAGVPAEGRRTDPEERGANAISAKDPALWRIYKFDAATDVVESVPEGPGEVYPQNRPYVLLTDSLNGGIKALEPKLSAGGRSPAPGWPVAFVLAWLAPTHSQRVLGWRRDAPGGAHGGQVNFSVSLQGGNYA